MTRYINVISQDGLDYPWCQRDNARWHREWLSELGIRTLYLVKVTLK